MKEIKLYICTNAAPRREDRAKVTYLLQYVKNGQDAGSREDHMAVDGNQKSATLEALISALTRINDGNTTPITIICHCPGVIQCINQVLHMKWQANGWKNSKGTEVECADMWERVSKLLKDKSDEIMARPPADEDQGIMRKLGAETYDPKTPLR